MRYVSLCLLALASCATSDDLKVISSTPASIEVMAWCGSASCVSRQAVTDMAQNHCRQSGQNAQIVKSELTERDFARGERTAYRFNCVR